MVEKVPSAISSEALDISVCLPFGMAHLQETGEDFALLFSLRDPSILAIVVDEGDILCQSHIHLNVSLVELVPAPVLLIGEWK